MRALRIQYEGAVYHVMSRGNNGQNTFINDHDKEMFLSILKSVRDRYDLIFHAYCIMDNHYHILLETKRANLSDSMRQINGVYTQSFNCKHDKYGHLFHGRYKSVICDKDNYFLALARYIVQNPLRAGIVNNPFEYRWSSINETISNYPDDELVTNPDFTLSFFSSNKNKAVDLYSSFIMDVTDESLWDNLKAGFIFGGDDFADKIDKMIEEEKRSSEIKTIQRYPARESLSSIFASFANTKERNRQILTAHLTYGHKIVTIAEHLGIHYSTVSHIIREELNQTPHPKT